MLKKNDPQTCAGYQYNNIKFFEYFGREINVKKALCLLAQSSTFTNGKKVKIRFGHRGRPGRLNSIDFAERHFG